MTNPIEGYRELTAEEVGLINDLKETERQFAEQLAKLGQHFNHLGRRDQGRWLSLARTHIETGFMFLTRAIARPTGTLGSDT